MAGAGSAASDDAHANSPVRAALHETGASLRSVFGQRALRRIQLALVGSAVGDWAYATAVTVWAYGAGGAKAVGLWAAIRLFIMSFSSPLAAHFADRLPRKRVMITADVARSLLVVAAAVCITTGTPSGFVYVLATVTSIFGTVFRPAQAALLPSLADRPEQLTASNGVSSTIESLAFFVGPALGATLVAATSVQSVFYLNAASFLWSAALVSSITVRSTEPVVEADEAEEADDADPESEEGGLGSMLAGFREIRRNRDLGFVAALTCTQTVIAGASPVLWVVVAVKILNTGPRGIGYIDATLGVGAVVGGFFALARAARDTLAVDLTCGVVLWSLPLLLIAASQTRAAVFAAVAMLGFGNPLVDVNFATAVQRIAPDRVLGRVFGALEGLFIATMALGAAVAPFLIDGIGLRTTLTILACVIGIPAVLVLPMARHVDRRLHQPDGLPLLRSVPIFAPLTPTQLDALARQLVRKDVPAGTVIVAKGDGAEEFFVIESGRVKVSRGRKTLREEGPGEYFGEIALLRDVPRTATVTAAEDTVLLGLSRTHFLDAVSGNAESAKVVDDVVVSRMRF